MHERVMLGVQVDRSVLPGQFDWAMLGTVIMTSFLGQMLLNRAFQISNASKASSINCVQVRSSESLLDTKAHILKKDDNRRPFPLQKLKGLETAHLCSI